jgi:hypothetical protein
MNLATDRVRSLRRQTWAIMRLGPPLAVPSSRSRPSPWSRRCGPYRSTNARPPYCTTWPTSQWRRSPSRWPCPAGRLKACSPAVGGHWRPSSGRRRRYSTAHERASRTTAGGGRRGRQRSRTPPAAALVTRGHHRRRRLIGGTAVLVVLIVVVGMVGAKRVTDRPMPLTPTPTAGPAPTTTPTSTTAPTQRWIPSVTPLTVKHSPGHTRGLTPTGL